MKHFRRYMKKFLQFYYYNLSKNHFNKNRQNIVSESWIKLDDEKIVKSRVSQTDLPVTFQRVAFKE